MTASNVCCDLCKQPPIRGGFCSRSPWRYCPYAHSSQQPTPLASKDHGEAQAALNFILDERFGDGRPVVKQPESGEVRRYDINMRNCSRGVIAEMAPKDDGRYVFISDFRRLQSALTAERGKLAVWMIQHNFVTGHGDTTDALLAELGAQVDERAQQLTAAQRETADLRNRLNLSEKLQGRFPEDAEQPDPEEPT